MPPSATPAPRTSTDGEQLYRVVSHGRGGAGNIAEGSIESEEDVTLPYLTSSVYTTGRGGTGNMASNDPLHPEYARAAQDVLLIPHPSSTDMHGGRGGAGNVFHPSEEEIKAAKAQAEAEEKARKQRPPPVDHSKIDYRGWADKGKDLLFRRSKN